MRLAILSLIEAGNLQGASLLGSSIGLHPKVPILRMQVMNLPFRYGLYWWSKWLQEGQFFLSADFNVLQQLLAFYILTWDSVHVGPMAL